MTHLAIGVVSYPGSRFAISQGPQGLAAELADWLAAERVDAVVRVNTENDGGRYGVRVTPATVQASLTEQLRLDRRWSRFLGRAMGPRWWIGHGARWAQRARQSVRPPSERSMTRLLDIEASHRDLLGWGLDDGADWVLILEDDAMSPDVADCGRGLLGIMQTPGPLPAYVNVSHSFSPSALGINHLLRPAEGAHWQGPAERVIYSARLPVTNTVCAILYRADFAARLLDMLERLPLEPIVPIDWKLNEALMALHARGLAGPDTCWLVEPAPIVQMSMR